MIYVLLLSKMVTVPYDDMPAVRVPAAILEASFVRWKIVDNRKEFCLMYGTCENKEAAKLGQCEGAALISTVGHGQGTPDKTVPDAATRTKLNSKGAELGTGFSVDSNDTVDEIHRAIIAKVYEAKEAQRELLR